MEIFIVKTPLKNPIDCYIFKVKVKASSRQLVRTFENGKASDSFDFASFNLLVKHEMNRHITDRYAKFINKFNVREIEFNPRNT